jgi:hypothetical protein
MTLTLIQIILLLVIILMAIHTIAQRQRNEIGWLQLAGWLAIWIAGAVVVGFPELANQVATRFKIGRGADLVIYIAIPALFYTVFRLLVRTERLNRDLTTLTRALAMEIQRREEGKP